MVKWTRRKVGRSVLAGVFAATVGLTLWAGRRGDWGRVIAVGDPAPFFEAQTLDGRVASSELLRGRKYLLVFFRPNCRYCRVELDEITSAQAGAGSAPVVAVSFGAESETRRFSAGLRQPLPTVLDARERLKKAFHIRKVPTLVRVGANGSVEYVRAGTTSPLELARVFAAVRQRPRAGLRAVAPCLSCGEP